MFIPKTEKIWKVYTDGGTRSNPGPGSYGVVIDYEDGSTEEFGGYLEYVTNNQAEYAALSAACQFLLTSPDLPDEIQFHADALLVVNQVNGEWQCRDATLHTHYTAACVQYEKLSRLVPISLKWIRRDRNDRADAIANEVMDRHGVVCVRKRKV